MASKEAEEWLNNNAADYSVSDSWTFNSILNVVNGHYTIDNAVDEIVQDNNEKIMGAFDAGVVSGAEGAIKIYNDFMEYKKKNEWHDLTKNPNDLPSKNGDYLCKLDSNFEKYGVKHFDAKPLLKYDNNWKGQGFRVIAWKEIE